MSRPVPSSGEIQAFLAELRLQRERLVGLTASGNPPTIEVLAKTIDEVGEQLLVADEELRVQNDQLTRSAQRLDLLVAAHEELFAHAPAAYVQTDENGLILRFNHAARDLLALPVSRHRARTLANLFRPDDRGTVRQLIGVARAGRDAATAAAPPRAVEATAVRADGRSVPVLLTVRGSSDAEMGRLLHWEVQPRSTPAPAAEAVQERRAALRAVAQAAETLARQENPALTTEEVVGQAVASVPGCEEAGITLVRARRSIETPAATAPLAARCDQLQHALSEGPCLDAFDTNQIVRVDDLADDLRWPRFVQEAVELGVRSVLTLPLTTPRGMVGTLNLYSSKPDAFDMDSELVGSAYATHAAIALMHADLEENLRIGLSTREEIGRAVGILMERHRINATGAFDMLVYASQHAHRKLRDVAMWVNETGEDPDSLLPSR